MSAIRRILQEARKHPLETAQAVLTRALLIPVRGVPDFSKSADEEDDFDERYGVETAQVVQVVVTDCPSRTHGTRYQTTSEEIIRWCIDNSGVDPATTTFIDLGCGKGRALIVAAQYAFKQIIGVEYSPELAAICDQNLRKAKCRSRSRVIVEDAATFVPPAGNLLVFMNNPFKAEIAVKVYARLAAHPERVVLAYRGPGHEIIRETGLFEEMLRRPDAARIYRLTKEARAVAA
jgi:SAM-dependent methyltransferase